MSENFGIIGPIGFIYVFDIIKTEKVVNRVVYL